MVEWHAAQHGLEQWDDALVLGNKGLSCPSCTSPVSAFLQVQLSLHHNLFVCFTFLPSFASLSMVHAC